MRRRLLGEAGSPALAFLAFPTMGGCSRFLPAFFLLSFFSPHTFLLSFLTGKKPRKSAVVSGIRHSPAASSRFPKRSGGSEQGNIKTGSKVPFSDGLFRCLPKEGVLAYCIETYSPGLLFRIVVLTSLFINMKSNKLLPHISQLEPQMQTMILLYQYFWIWRRECCDKQEDNRLDEENK